MDAAPASRRAVELSAVCRGWSKGLTSDHRGTRRAVMVEFYTTVRVTGRRRPAHVGCRRAGQRISPVCPWPALDSIATQGLPHRLPRRLERLAVLDVLVIGVPDLGEHLLRARLGRDGYRS